MIIRRDWWAFFTLTAALNTASCTSKQASAPRETSSPEVLTASPAPSALAVAETKVPEPPAPVSSPREKYVAWLKTKVPKGDRVEDVAGAPVKVIHVPVADEHPMAIARAYLDLATIYTPNDFHDAIVAANPVLRRGVATAGSEVVVPALVEAPFESGESNRLGWPEDKVLRGLFLRQDYGAKFPGLLAKMVSHGMNAIVLDGKDYEGYVTYPTKVGLANEVKADQHAPMFSLARVVRWAHEKGIRVVMRNACFHDPWMAKQRPDLSVQSKWGKPYPLQWVDPSNATIQAYILEVIKEQIAVGVDEIQLDYIRYPVQGIQGADFHLEERGLTQTKVIRDFVHEVHTLTKEHGVPLSLDIFGVVAWNRPEDVQPLGQDVGVLAAECEALSPMLYPSHFAAGFQGFAEPGDHPEVIGIGTKATLEQIHKAGLSTLVRPWLQAFPMKSPSYGPQYVANEAKSAETSGGTGWLLWHPGGDYGTSFRGFPVIKTETLASAGAARVKAPRTQEPLNAN